MSSLRLAFFGISVPLLGMSCDSHHQNNARDAGTPSLPDSGAADAGPISDAGAPGLADSGADAGLLSDAGALASNDAGTDGRSPVRYRFPAEVLVKGCAKALSCSGAGHTSQEGITHCAEVVNWMGSTDWSQNTFMLAAYDDDDWLLLAGLMQNMDCIQSAVGCDAVRACLNQGQPQATCTRPAIYSLGRHCSDDTHLRGCSLGIEASIDCGKLGLPCVEVSTVDGSKKLAACASLASPPADTTGTVEVTCQGELAQYAFGSARFGFDCGFFGANCVPGTYTLSNNLGFCVGAGPRTCPSNQTRASQCDGDNAVFCINGFEADLTCADIGATCNAVFPNDNPHCGFACAGTPDTCTGGVIGYCGPAGLGTLDCKALGFADCQLDTSDYPSRAWCVP